MKPQGKQRVQDKTMRTLQSLVNLTPDVVTGGVQVNQLGFLPIGNYKGTPAFWDLDKAVNQPLVYPEQLHILGILDGREEDYDLQTITIPNGSAVGSVITEDLTVPTGEVWFINAVRLVTPADAGGRANINWRCSLWTDRLAAAAAGQLFTAAGYANVAGGTWWDEFHAGAPFIGPNNKNHPLRLPAGTVITFQATNTLAIATGAMACTGALFGWIGKALVA
jgi:hypothetical protein